MASIIVTAKDRCRRCYSCVRRCPAKAIRVRGGQAEVIEERCLSCGRCVNVCSQGAREIVGQLPRARSLLASGKAVMMLAPSFPAAFLGRHPGQVLAGLRRLGFVAVHEVAFGADLVAAAYRDLQARDPERLLITTPCPAAVDYVRKFAPELIASLAPVLSPMAALGKVIKTRLSPGVHTVFAGPCTAKIVESQDPVVAPWVDAVLTFPEVQQLFGEAGIDLDTLALEEFDPPYSRLGGIFPAPGGLTRTAGITCDLLENRVADVNGPGFFIDVISRLRQRAREAHFDDLETRLFDVLFCEGCLAGPAMHVPASPLVRKECIVAYIRTRQRLQSEQAAQSTLARFADVDLSRGFDADAQCHPDPSEEDIRRILALTGKHTSADELNCGACGYRSCREKATAVYHGFAEVEMCLPYLVEGLESVVAKLNHSHEQLTLAQAQLLRTERLASMGQLAAGIAHEVSNPLGTILIYAHLLADTVRKAGELQAGEVEGDIQMILAEATRCKSIVSGLLDFARQNKVSRTSVVLRDLLEEAVRLVEAQTRDARYRLLVEAPADMPKAYVDHQQLLQVVINLVRNAVEAMPNGGMVRVAAEWLAKTREFKIRISDSGQGIPPDAVNKLFTPFFTTKPQGRGTGLGLPICYGIVKMHRGQISARNNRDGAGATFEIVLPEIWESNSAVAVGAETSTPNAVEGKG